MATLRLLAREGRGGADRELTIASDEVTLGRDRDNTFPISGTAVSRRHARILVTSRGHLLVDTDSVNGVWVGDKKIRHHFLESGDVFHIGDRDIEFWDDDEGGATLRMDSPLGSRARAAQSSPPTPVTAPGRPAPPPAEPPPPAAPRPPRPRPLPAQAHTVCARCGASIPPSVGVCPTCGTSLFKRPPSRRGVWLTVFFGGSILALGLLTVIGVVFGRDMLRQLRPEPPADPQVVRFAPAVAGFGQKAQLRGRPIEAEVGPDGGTLDLPGGGHLEAPQGAFPDPTRLAVGVVDLRLGDAAPDVREAAVYAVDALGDINLANPMVLEVPQPSQEVAVAAFENGSWQLLSFPEGPTTRIEIGHLSLRQYAVVRWTKSAGTPATAAERAALEARLRAVLSPDLKDAVAALLGAYLHQFDGSDFRDVVSLGRPEQIRQGLATDLEIEIVPALAQTGRYAPGEARVFGRFFNRPALLQVKELRATAPASDHTPLWHETVHHLVRLQGGEECGREEAYTQVLEERVGWLGALAKFDEGVRQGAACPFLTSRWDALVQLWNGKGLQGVSLSGPYTWADADGTCGSAGAKHTIDAAFLARWDEKLGMDVDIAKVHAFYDARLQALGCSLKPPPAGPAAPEKVAAKPKPAPTATPCPSMSPVPRKCPWTGEGYAVGACGPGYCWDGGPQGSLACKQEESVPNSGRNYTSDLVCWDGYKTVRDACTNVIVRCEAPPPAPPAP